MFGLLVSLTAAVPGSVPPAAVSGRVIPRLLSIPPVSDFYPPEALAQEQEGRTMLRCRLPVAGMLIDCTLHQSSGFPALDAAAFKLASHARYSPMMEDGVARDTIVILPVRWVVGR